MSLESIDKKIYKVELAKRIGNQYNLVGGYIWDTEWLDITDYFVDRLDEVATSLDDSTLQGRIEQSSTSLRFDNVTGKFNPNTVETSFWASDEYVYHSRIRLWEFYEDEDIESSDKYPLIDGLIATEPKYREGMVVDIRVNSKLDILREHYVLEGIVGRTKVVGAQAVIRVIEDLFNNVYTELGVKTYGGLFRESVIYDNISPFSSDLLQLMQQVVNDGGGIGGLTRKNDLFFTYFGATAVERANFEDDANCIGLWHMDDTDYGTTTIADKTSLGYDLTTDNSFTDNWRDEGFFYNAVRTWRRNSTDYDGLTTYTIEIVLDFAVNRVPIKKAYYDPFKPNKSIIHPIFVFSQDTATNMSFIDAGGSVGSPSDRLFEGFFVDEKCELAWIKGKRTLENGEYIASVNTYSQDGTTIDEFIELTPLFGEGFKQYLAFTMDTVAKEINVYLNGKLKKTIGIHSIGGFTVNKILGTGFGYILQGPFDTLGHVYYSSMKISDNVKTASEVFTQYTKLFGSTFTIGE